MGEAKDSGAVALDATLASDPALLGTSATVAARHASVAGSAVADDLAKLAARRYEILGELARGGVGRILRARDLAFDRIVALKEPLDPRFGTRLRAEAAILALLQHPSIVPVYDTGTHADGTPFFAMKLVEGAAMLDAIDRAKTFEDRLALIPQVVAVAGAVAYAHSQGVIHRDLKPANILLGSFGETIVIDWGLAKVLGPEGDPAVVSIVPTVSGETVVGAVMGTPQYMAPEQARGETIDARSDVYALGAVLYHVLAGVPPFAGRAPREIIAAVSIGGPDKLAEPRAPADLVAIVTKAMARAPADRYPSAAQLAEDLVRFQTGRLVAARRYSLANRARRWMRAHRGILAATALAAAAATTIAVLAMPGASRPGARCDRAGDQTIWSAARAAQVRAAFAATGRVYAADTADRVVARLDDYTRQWSALRVETCRATYAHGEQSEARLDLKMACFDRLRTEAGELADVFAKATAPSLVDDAVAATGKLAPLAACDDIAALETLVPLPASPAKRAEIARLEQRHAAAVALLKTNQYKPALAIVKELAPDAVRLDHAPTLAAILSTKQELEMKTSDLAAAEITLREAMNAAVDARDDKLIAGLWTDEIYLIGNARGKPDDALKLQSAAELAVRRAHGPPEDGARLQGNLGIALVRAGKFAAARPYVERALDLRQHAAHPDPIQIAGSLIILASLDHEEGKFVEAVDRQRESLAMYETVLSPDHPLIALARSNLGTLLRSVGKYDEAETNYEQALATRTRTFGPDSVEVASTLNNLGIIARLQGKIDVAADDYARALAIREKLLGPDHVDVADSLTSLGTARKYQGKLDEARAMQLRALAIYEKALGVDHPRIAYPLQKLAELDQAQGKYAEALREAQRALAITEKAHGPEFPEVAEPLQAIAEAQLAMNHLVEAQAAAERAVKIAETANSDPDELAGVRFALARVLWAANQDRPRARTLAIAARDGFAKFGPGTATDRAEAEAWLRAHP